MGGPTLAKVDLYGVVFPLTALLDRNEVHPVTAQHPFGLEHLTDPHARPLNHKPVSLIGREGRPEIDLL